jgi:hypothetical protein
LELVSFSVIHCRLATFPWLVPVKLNKSIGVLVVVLASATSCADTLFRLETRKVAIRASVRRVEFDFIWFGFACYVRIDMKKVPKSKCLTASLLRRDAGFGHSQGGKFVLISAKKLVDPLAEPVIPAKYVSAGFTRRLLDFARLSA